MIYSYYRRTARRPSCSKSEISGTLRKFQSAGSFRTELIQIKQVLPGTDHFSNLGLKSGPCHHENKRDNMTFRHPSILLGHQGTAEHD
jgi:hypothetical protein